MEDINVILMGPEMTAEEKVELLSTRMVSVPEWGGANGLESQYDKRKHPVMDKGQYPDIVLDGKIEKVTRITIGLQELAVRRLVELIFGQRVVRTYKAEDEKQELVTKVLEAIYAKNRIDSLNIKRFHKLFASCEMMTLWYGVEHSGMLYGVQSPLKLRCRVYSPMDGDKLYPLFNEVDDLVALSIGYEKKQRGEKMEYLDTYTDSWHIQYTKGESGDWVEAVRERITIFKIPAAYINRDSPAWKDTSENIYEMEWSLSRNGNYLRENSRPLLAVFADEVIRYGDEANVDSASRSVGQYPKDGRLEYVTWEQAVENLKYYVNELRSWVFTELQLPDWSYEKMISKALSGEAMKQALIDAHLKVVDESGDILEFLDRELNVLRAFVKKILGESYHEAIDSLEVEMTITPFSIGSEKETIENLLLANGNLPIISQKESIELYGHSNDVEQTMKEIGEQGMLDVFNMHE